jgi:prevent-host-death family protein
MWYPLSRVGLGLGVRGYSMKNSMIPTTTMKFTEARPQLSELLNRVFQRETRILIQKGNIPVAALVSVDDLERLNRMDAERDIAFAVFDEIGDAFADQTPQQIAQEVARAITEAREDQHRTREVAISE